MPMSTYVFYYKADSTCEPIGRVKATHIAQEPIIVEEPNIEDHTKTEEDPYNIYGKPSV